MKELFRLSLEEASDLLARREVSSVELTESVLDRIQATEERIQSFLTITAEAARKAAQAADERRRQGESAPLLGIPVGIKDIINVKGVRTTAGSKILESFVSPYDATVTARLLQAGAVSVGKLNCDEFAMGSSNENSAYHVTRNPWDLDRVPGGSSGGSAAAVAALQCLGALGTDTGGSIRQPAACTGVVGLKPTYGRVSRYGVVAYASSLDQVGPMTRTVKGCAHLLSAIAGYDPLDSTSSRQALPDFAASLRGEVKGLRVGVPREFFVEGMQPAVETAVREALRLLEGMGAILTEVTLPHTQYAVPTYYLVATAEASSNLARYDGIKYGLRVAEEGGLASMYQRTRGQGFGPEVKRRIMLGTYALSAGYYDAYYLKALKVRSLIRRDFERVFESQDVLLTPTAPTTAFRFGEKSGDPLQMYLSDIFTISVNLAGLPGLSLPCGFDEAGLPVGLQIIGKPFDEERVLQVAYAYEQATAWHRKTAEL